MSGQKNNTPALSRGPDAATKKSRSMHREYVMERRGSRGEENCHHPGKHWQFPPQILDEMDARGEIYWSPTGNPCRKVYFDTSDGIPTQDIWLDFRDAHNQNIGITGYPTEKNPALLKRIIAASSNEGDLVLDCFSGSGTTLAVASELERRWIGIDNSAEAIKTTLHRFANGLAPMGDFVSKQVSSRREKSIQENQLWESLEDLKELEELSRSVSRKRQRAIKDFILCSAETCEEDLSPILSQWLAWL